MTTENTLENRILALEERTAFQDQAIDDLNTTITDQWKQLETFKREIARLTDEMREMEAANDGAGRKDPPPPHY